MTITDITRKHNDYQDALVASFERQLRAMVNSAQARVMSQLQKKLAITDGVIDQTPGNMRVLRSLNSMFLREMDKLGFDHLVEAFVDKFHEQLPFLQDILKSLSDQMKTPLPAFKMTAKDLDILSGFQANAVTSIEGALETAASASMTRGLLTVGGLKFGDLVEALQAKFDVGVAQAAGLAETSQSIFFRTAADRAYQAIQDDVPGQELRYSYIGPADKLNRPFCHDLIRADKDYTRAQIDKMDNGQFPVGSVFTVAGGWRCRHIFGISTRAWEAAKAAA